MIKLFFCDTETTGTDPSKHGIHQISIIIEYVDENGRREVKNKINIKMKPASQLEINDEALEVSGISREILETYTDENIAFKNLQQVLKLYVNPFNKQDKFFFVGYNVHFDIQFMRELFTRNKDKYFGSMFWSNSIDVMTIAGLQLINERHDMPNFQLMTVGKRMGIGVDEDSAHDAMYDIEITREMFWRSYNLQDKQQTQPESDSNQNIDSNKSKLLGKTNLSEVKPLTDQKTILKIDSEDYIFTFGKHTGQTITDILEDNPSYIMWVHDNFIKGIQFSHSIMDKAVKLNSEKQTNFKQNKRFYGSNSGDTVLDYQIDSYDMNSDSPF